CRGEHCSPVNFAWLSFCGKAEHEANGLRASNARPYKAHAKTSRRDIFAKKNFSQKGKSQKVTHKAATGKNTVP
ncbi:MAG: hypothetical protein UGA93_12370, partial [Gemmiger formicilis]|uniref:hypothetical protein n=1 Tax=Gemmiger formicilis TaxID=745368 RepID=UPI002E76182B